MAFRKATLITLLTEDTPLRDPDITPGPHPRTLPFKISVVQNSYRNTEITNAVGSRTADQTLSPFVPYNHTHLDVTPPPESWTDK